MSRIGKRPIHIPEGVEVEVRDSLVRVRGPKGEVSQRFRDEISFALTDNVLTLAPRKDAHTSRALWGTYASLVQNMIEGVTSGFSKRLELEGIGFKALLEGRNLKLWLGFSHPLTYKAPEGIDIGVEKNSITISGIDKEKVGLAASQIRALKKPEPYKGKGIRYEGELVRRKAGKKAVGAG